MPLAWLSLGSTRILKETPWRKYRSFLPILQMIQPRVSDREFSKIAEQGRMAGCGPTAVSMLGSLLLEEEGDGCYFAGNREGKARVR